MAAPGTWISQIKEWQTLIAGFLALVGAGLTVWIGRRQIKAADDRAIDARERKFMAARAILPEDLSTICAYTDQCAQIVYAAIRSHREQLTPPNDMQMPILDSRVAANLQQLIEHLDRHNARQVAALLSCYQVQRARLGDAVNGWSDYQPRARRTTFTQSNIEHPLIETIQLRIHTNNMFGFARDEEKTIPAIDKPDVDTFRTAFKNVMDIGFPRDSMDEALMERMREQLLVIRNTR